MELSPEPELVVVVVVPGSVLVGDVGLKDVVVDVVVVVLRDIVVVVEALEIVLLELVVETEEVVFCACVGPVTVDIELEDVAVVFIYSPVSSSMVGRSRARQWVTPTRVEAPTQRFDSANSGTTPQRFKILETSDTNPITFGGYAFLITT